MRAPVITAFVAAVTVAGVAGAAAPPQDVNLDGDPEAERVLDRDIRCYRDAGTAPPPCAEGEARSAMISVADTCADGTPSLVNVFRRSHHNVAAYIREVDGDPSRPELFSFGSDGASGRAGEIVITGYDGTGCATQRFLFRHSNSPPTTRRPRGASYASLGDARPRELRRDFRGKELRVTQPWYKRRDPGCCPTFVVRADWRYSARGRRYVKYRERVQRLPRPG